MFSPSYGKDGMASVPILVTGLVVVLIGCLFIVLKLRKDKKEKNKKESIEK
ncbi:conserved hypothetical protein [Listeria ivanovii FSL F6-596]|nr:conserved hypothetical protein [Listeria ivanovii FSL F6-596]